MPEGLSDDVAASGTADADKPARSWLARLMRGSRRTACKSTRTADGVGRRYEVESPKKNGAKANSPDKNEAKATSPDRNEARANSPDKEPSRRPSPPLKKKKDSRLTLMLDEIGGHKRRARRLRAQKRAASKQSGMGDAGDDDNEEDELSRMERTRRSLAKAHPRAVAASLRASVEVLREDGDGVVLLGVARGTRTYMKELCSRIKTGFQGEHTIVSFVAPLTEETVALTDPQIGQIFWNMFMTEAFMLAFLFDSAGETDSGSVPILQLVIMGFIGAGTCVVVGLFNRLVFRWGNRGRRFARRSLQMAGAVKPARQIAREKAHAEKLSAARQHVAEQAAEVAEKVSSVRGALDELEAARDATLHIPKEAGQSVITHHHRLIRGEKHVTAESIEAYGAALTEEAEGGKAVPRAMEDTTGGMLINLVGSTTKGTTASCVTTLAFSGATPEELAKAETELRAAFNKYDRNNGGTLDRKELRKAVESVGLTIVSGEAKELLARYDTDQSGEMDFNEYRDLCIALEREGTSARAAFNKYDRNHSGKLDRTELRKALAQVGLVLDSKEAEDLLDKYDADGSGEMDFEEFKQLCFALEQEAAVTTAQHVADEQHAALLKAQAKLDAAETHLRKVEDGSGGSGASAFFIAVRENFESMWDQRPVGARQWRNTGRYVVAWLVAFITFFMMAWFCLTMAVMFGEEKTQQWMLSLVIASSQSWIIIEPFEVIFLALFPSLLDNACIANTRDTLKELGLY